MVTRHRRAVLTRESRTCLIQASGTVVTFLSPIEGHDLYDGEDVLTH